MSVETLEDISKIMLSFLVGEQLVIPIKSAFFFFFALTQFFFYSPPLA